MSRIEMLRVLVNERLASAAEEIFGVFERTIEDYVEEIDRLTNLLDDLHPETKINKELALHLTDHLQLIDCEEEVPSEQLQQRTLSLGQEQQLQQRTLSLGQEQQLQQRSLSLGQELQQRSLSLGQEQQQRSLSLGQEQQQRSLSLGQEQQLQQRSLSLGQEQQQRSLSLGQEQHQRSLSLGQEQQQQQRSLSLDQEQPQSPQFKEEQEELWTSQGEEQLQELEEADIIKLPFTPIPVKKENEEKKPQSSWFNQTQTEDVAIGASLPSTSTEHMKTELDGEADRNFDQASDLPSTSTEHMKTELDGEVCGGSEPDGNLDPAVDTEPTPDDQLLSSDFYRTEAEDCDAWMETREPQSVSNRWRLKKMQKVKGQCLSNSNKFKIPGELFPELKSSNQTQASHCCKVCRNSFPNKRSLLAHVTGKFHPHNCGLCGKHLEPTESFKFHLNAHRKCKVCGKEFPCFKGLERHERIHTGEKPFSCTVCGKGFGQNQHLQIHMRIHTGEKPFSCTVCGERFSRSETLQSHMTNHTGVRTFRSECVQNETLQNDMRMHMGEKPFSCIICGRAFSRFQHLQNHMRIHTGEKPFSCTVCGNRFGESKTLKIHMRIHTGAKPYSCGLCGRSYRHISSLNRHKCCTGV